MLIPSLLLLAQAAQAQSPAIEKQPIKDLVEVEISSAAEYDALLQTCTDVDDHHPYGFHDHAVVYATDAEQLLLAERGFTFEVQIEDLATYYEERARLDSNSRMSVGSMGGFRTWAEVIQELDRLTSTYPGIVSPKFSIGTSIQGRDIWAVRISTNPGAHDPSKPVAWFDAMHHSREPMAGESVLAFGDYLASNYGVDAGVTRIVETRNTLLIPVVNPDGYEYNRQTNPNGGGLWRKNRRGSYGVDLNRNYDWEWGPQWNGSSGNQNSETYRGASPFSEPETAAIRDILATQTPGMSVSAHTYSNLWLYPWGYDTVFTSEDQAFDNWSEEQTAHNGWAYGTAWEVLYTANGVSDDYHYGEHGTYAFTPEIGGSGDGFWPSPSRIPALTADALPTYELVARWTGSWADPVGFTWSEVSGNGDAFPEPGETWSLQPQVRNYGATTLLGTARLLSNVAEITVSGGAVNMNVGQQQTDTLGAFTVSFDQSALVGQTYTLEVEFDYEGYADRTEIDIELGRDRQVLHDDMEADWGWTSNNNTNWSWERANPQSTSTGGQTAQPENDNPAGSGVNAWVTGAAAGSSAGTNDVDGTAILTSPRFALGDLSNAKLEYARFFANLPGNAQDDRFVVELSNDDGASWVQVEAASNANSWQTITHRVTDYVSLTDNVRVRVTVADNPNNDITEGLLDDVRFTTVSSLPTLGALGQAAIGEDLRFHFDGTAGQSWTLVYSFQRNGGSTVPGIDGEFFLTNYQVLQSGTLGGDGTGSFTATVPNDPNLQGRTVYLQAVIDYNGSSAAFTNPVSLPIE